MYPFQASFLATAIKKLFFIIFFKNFPPFLLARSVHWDTDTAGDGGMGDRYQSLRERQWLEKSGIGATRQ